MSLTSDSIQTNFHNMILHQCMKSKIVHSLITSKNIFRALYNILVFKKFTMVYLNYFNYIIIFQNYSQKYYTILQNKI